MMPYNNIQCLGKIGWSVMEDTFDGEFAIMKRLCFKRDLSS